MVNNNNHKNISFGCRLIVVCFHENSRFWGKQNKDAAYMQIELKWLSLIMKKLVINQSINQLLLIKS